MSVYQVTLKTASGRLDVMRIIAADRLAAMEIANRIKLSAEFRITDCHARELVGYAGGLKHARAALAKAGL
jgi:hypothetical protein